MGYLDAVVEEKLAGDSEFQSSLEALSEEEKVQAIATKRAEILDSEFTALTEKEKKAAQIAEDQRKRAEKAELTLKEKAGNQAPSQDGQLSPKDYLALTEAKVSSEDFDEVMRVSKILGKNLTETLKDKTMQSILKERVDERTTAQATQTQGGTRGQTQAAPEVLLDKARKGELPQNDADIEKLVQSHLKK